MASVALQSKDHKDLLDIIDKLRSQGITKYVDLPQIVVCGDQSAGKSSVLEAISGLSFPTKDNLCTRFATELVLRRHVTAFAKVSINPGPDRTAEQRQSLAKFHAEINLDAPDIGSVIEAAKKAMGLSETKVFSSDALRVELCGPSQPHLTMVDLPGLFRAGNREQSLEDAATVEKMVCNYVKSPRSIILAVVSAKSDFALQEITQMARDMDPDGERTLGLITKPDALDAGSDSEASYLKLAQNKDVVFDLGWHVLKNRDYKMRDATSAERDEAEKDFFASGIWATVDPSLLGVKTLTPKLSNILKEQILHQLPHLLKDIDSEIFACNAQLQKLGTPRSTLLQQRKYLMQVSKDFTLLMKDAVDGEYNHPFFGSATTAEGQRKRLRARVQNALDDFAKELSLNGQRREIVDTDLDTTRLRSRQVSRSDYINEVKDLMRQSRGRELPGTFNPLLIGELFADQCRPWTKIAMEVETEILRIVNDVTMAVVNSVAVEGTGRAICHKIDGGIDQLQMNLSQKCKELLRPHFEGHPITYNQDLTENVQKAQNTRRRHWLEGELKRATNQDKLSARAKSISFSTLSLLNALQRGTELNMDRFGSELAIDYMEAYYKVALKRFVDDVSIHAVEECLVRKLPFLFQSDLILDLEDKEIARLASENENSKQLRIRCADKLKILEDGRKELNQLDIRRPLASEPSRGDIAQSRNLGEDFSDISPASGSSVHSTQEDDSERTQEDDIDEDEDKDEDKEEAREDENEVFVATESAPEPVLSGQYTLEPPAGATVLKASNQIQHFGDLETVDTVADWFKPTPASLSKTAKKKKKGSSIWQ